MSEHTNLYFEGLLARLIIVGGWLLAIVGFFSLFGSFVIGLFILVGGIALIVWGKAKRFEFQKKSGHIIHRGD